jgi:hypothetical protein
MSFIWPIAAFAPFVAFVWYTHKTSVSNVHEIYREVSDGIGTKSTREFEDRELSKQFEWRSRPWSAFFQLPPEICYR